MDIEEAVKFFKTWHCAYSLQNKEDIYPSRHWEQCVVQELLDRMLPYIDVEVTEDIKDVEVANEEEAKWQKREANVVFEFIRKIVMDVMHQISSIVYTLALGYDETEDEETVINAMNGEEIEHYGAVCKVIFHGFAEAELHVTFKKEDSDKAAQVNRYITERLLCTFPTLPVVCKYDMEAGLDWYTLSPCLDTASSLEEAVFLLIHDISMFKGCTAICFTPAYCLNGKAFVSFYFRTDNEPVEASKRSGDFYKEKCWLSYCQRLCDQTLASAYHVIVGDIETLDQEEAIEQKK